jgi:hypothetical protein
MSIGPVVVHRQLADPQAVRTVQVIDAELAPSDGRRCSARKTVNH